MQGQAGRLSFPGRKGQVAFEFVIVLSVVLFLSSAVMLDFFQESNVTLMAGYSKNLVESQVGVSSITNKECLGAYLHSFEIEDNTVLVFTVKGGTKNCRPDDGEVAYQVEKTLCGGKANKNNVIECGIQDYVVKIQWEEDQ